jgi:AraC-like DNA-binding protein
MSVELAIQRDEHCRRAGRYLFTPRRAFVRHIGVTPAEYRERYAID